MKKDKVSINDLLKAIVRYIAGVVVGVCLLSIIAIIAGQADESIIKLVLSFNGIIYIGIVTSLIIHECAHFIAMRKCGVRDIGIETTSYRFSVYTYEDVRGKKLLIIALAGATSAIMCGGILYVINIFLHSKTLMVILWIYFIHLINILPLFGDGKMILKALLTLKDA